MVERALGFSGHLASPVSGRREAKRPAFVFLYGPNRRRRQ
jgi:hypothetical protein